MREDQLVILIFEHKLSTMSTEEDTTPVVEEQVAQQNGTSFYAP